MQKAYSQFMEGNTCFKEVWITICHTVPSECRTRYKCGKDNHYILESWEACLQLALQCHVYVVWRVGDLCMQHSYLQVDARQSGTCSCQAHQPQTALEADLQEPLSATYCRNDAWWAGGLLTRPIQSHGRNLENSNMQELGLQFHTPDHISLSNIIIWRRFERLASCPWSWQSCRL